MLKNIESNTTYASKLLKTCDILVMQEHWFFSFQLPDLEKSFPSHFAYSKAVDDHNFLPNPETKGYWRSGAIIQQVFKSHDEETSSAMQ